MNDRNRDHWGTYEQVTTCRCGHETNLIHKAADGRLYITCSPRCAARAAEAYFNYRQQYLRNHSQPNPDYRPQRPPSTARNV